MEGGACNVRNYVLIFWMTPFQHVASSTGKSVASSPASSLCTRVSLWTVRGAELWSQQRVQPCWPHTGQQMVSHCHLEGSTKPHIHSKGRQSAYSPAAANIWKDATQLRADISPRTLRQINTAHCPGFRGTSAEGLTHHNTMHDRVQRKLQHWHNYNREDSLQHRQEIWQKYSPHPHPPHCTETTNCIIMLL